MPVDAPTQRWDVVYARCFQNQPEGHAIYEPLTTNELKPGICGFWDHHGNWQTIADLSDLKALSSSGYTFVPGLEYKSITRGKWRVRTSEHVTKLEIGSGVNVSTPALPARGGGEARYKTSSNEGTILLTDGETTASSARPTASMVQWMEKNAKRALSLTPDARDKSIWIVTKTYSVARRALAILKSNQDEVGFKISASAAEMGHVEASVSWWESPKGTAWNEYDHPDGVVVAFDGIFWDNSWFKLGSHVIEEHRPTYLSRSDGDFQLKPVVMDFEAEGRTVELTPQIKGPVEGVTLDDPASSESKEGEVSDDEAY